MQRNSPAKQILFFLIGSLINIALFTLSKYTAFPLWWDYTGSFYITSACGPTLGFVSAALHTAILAILIDGPTALWMFLPAAAICGVLTLYQRAMLNGRGYSVPETVGVGTVCAWAPMFLAFICSPSLPTRYLGYNGAFEALWNTHGKFLSALILSAGVTLVEILPSMMILLLLSLITPKNRDGLSFHK